MKIPFPKIPGLNNIAARFRSHPKLFIFSVFVLVVILGFMTFLGGRETTNIKKSLRRGAETDKLKDRKEDKDVGVLVGSVDTKSYVLHIDKQYYDITAKTDAMQARIEAIEKNINELHKKQSDVGQFVMDTDKRIKEMLSQNAGVARIPGQAARQPMLNLEIAKVSEIKNEDKTLAKKSVYLPLGSFVKCTLLTGVYAPANENNPLPVLISVDEAFYGPNNARIPLKGAFAIGKAVGDIVSRRAIIQIVSISTVLADGKVFEHEANIGYLADKDGQLGIVGELIYNTGKQLGLDFLSGFLSGGAEALSQAETSTVTGAYGQTSRNVTGNTGRYSMFSGLAKSAEGMSSYYQKQLENMVPAVRIEAGRHVTFVVQKGVEIDGLEIPSDNFGYIN